MESSDNKNFSFALNIPKMELKKAVEPLIIDFNELHAKVKLNLASKPLIPPVAISIGTEVFRRTGEHYPLIFGTFGNISMIKGEEKSRKTWFKTLLLGCCVGGGSSLYAPEIRPHGLNDKYIIDLDTEQDKYYNWLSASRITKMYGSSENPVIPENFISLNLREYSARIRRQYIEWLFMESEYRLKLGVVSIDGFVDCIDNFNDLVECVDFTQSLMKYSTLSKSHITGVLHLNPGTDKARGHLGTILQQKCETVVQVKDEGDYSSVTCHRSRGNKFETFGIRINDERLPEVCEHEMFEAQNAKRKPSF